MKALQMHQSVHLNNNDHFPSKNYSKYRSQAKTKPFLTKLDPSTGYPQPLVAMQGPHSSCPSSPEKNYVEENKEKLKNFFSNRLPSQDISLHHLRFTIDASKMFYSIRKKQDILKMQTREVLKEGLDSHFDSGKLDTAKISTSFQCRNIGNIEEFKQPKAFLQPQYQADNFLRGTKSSIRKYNEIVKKQAYKSVFGPEKSAVTSKTMTVRSNHYHESGRPSSTCQEKRQHQKNSASLSKELETKKKFSSLIKKMDGYRITLDPQNRRGKKEYIPPKSLQDRQCAKNQLITWIQLTTQSYKQNSIQFGRQQLHEMEDLQKLDKNFYKDLKKHKAKRLQIRSSYVNNICILNRPNTLRFNCKQSKNDQDLQVKSFSDQSQHQSDQYSISQSQESVQEFDPIFKNTPVYLFKKLIRLLVDALTQARFFGIQSKENIYKAFWKNPAPYEKCGSYAFFKAVKKGDLEAVKGFIGTDREYVYERDHKGRSALIIAALNNHTKLINYLLECDVNVNKRCSKFKTALFYTIKNKNKSATKTLLQKGAIPWSTKSCRYNKLLQKIKSQEMNNLMKNARRIAILIQMQPNKKQKVILWKQLKHKISQTDIIGF